jgi:hypothetical protein
MDNTILQTGTLTSTGANQTIVLRSDFDWIRVTNETQTWAQPGGGNAAGVQWYWRRGNTAGQGTLYYKSGAADGILATQITAGYGFYPINSSTLTAGAAIAVTAGTNATQPVYSTGTTAPIAVGSIVRLYGTNQTNLNGLDFTVGAVTAATNFTMSATLPAVPGSTAGAAGYWRFVAPDLATYKLFAPARRTIANITAANPAVVTTLVDHGYVTGQVVRLNVPAVCGMTQMNGLTGTVTVTAVNTFSINIDASAFTAFNFPAIASVPCTYAEVLPIGAISTVLSDATYNQGYIGVTLAGGLAAVPLIAAVGTYGPAGVTADVLYWETGKVFNGV